MLAVTMTTRLPYTSEVQNNNIILILQFIESSEMYFNLVTLSYTSVCLG